MRRRASPGARPGIALACEAFHARAALSALPAQYARSRRSRGVGGARRRAGGRRGPAVRCGARARARTPPGRAVARHALAARRGGGALACAPRRSARGLGVRSPLAPVRGARRRGGRAARDARRAARRAAHGVAVVLDRAGHGPHGGSRWPPSRAPTRARPAERDAWRRCWLARRSHSPVYRSPRSRARRGPTTRATPTPWWCSARASTRTARRRSRSLTACARGRRWWRRATRPP
jgi:hypothetical protein